jgi:hypothetical protein
MTYSYLYPKHETFSGLLIVRGAKDQQLRKKCKNSADLFFSIHIWTFLHHCHKRENSTHTIPNPINIALWKLNYVSNIKHVVVKKGQRWTLIFGSRPYEVKQELNSSETSCDKIKRWRSKCGSILLIGQTKSGQGGWNTLFAQTVLSCYAALSKTSTLLIVPSFFFNEQLNTFRNFHTSIFWIFFKKLKCLKICLIWKGYSFVAIGNKGPKSHKISGKSKQLLFKIS